MDQDVLVSWFVNIRIPTDPIQASLMEVLNAIKDGITEVEKTVRLISQEQDHHKRNSLKVMALPVFTPCGTFSVREDASLIQMSSVICLDLDDVKNPQGVINDLRKCPFVLAIFTSPSLTGLKVLILHDLKDPSRNRDLYIHLGNMLSLTGRNDLTFDTSCTNISRACFMSYSKDMYLNTAATAFHVDVDTLPIASVPTKETRTASSTQSAVTAMPLSETKDIKDTIVKTHDLFEKFHSMYEGKRNTNLFILASFFKDNGIPLSYAEDYLVAYYVDPSKGFNAEEIKTTVRSAYK